MRILATSMQPILLRMILKGIFRKVYLAIMSTGNLVKKIDVLILKGFWI
jgi:hypothetical protein